MAINWPSARHAEIAADRTPLGIEIAAGSAVLIVAGLIAASIPASYQGWRFGVVVAAAALFAAISLDLAAIGPVALIAYAICNGFLEDRFGQLSWHGSADVWRLLWLVIACGLGLAAGEATRAIARLRDGGRSGRPRDTPSMKEEEHGA